VTEQTWRWVRSAAAKYEDAWRERLSFLKPDSLVIHGHPGRKLIRIEAYAGKPAGLRVLAEVFGGKVEKFDTDRIAARANAPRRPLRIGRKLGIIDTNGRWPDNLPRPEILLRIGSAMAFGTGEHATTSSCLRFLINEAESCGPEWTCLDLGTGSGILAMAAEKLGAVRVRAIDYDARAVKAARENLRRNRCKRVTLTGDDLLKWNTGRTRYRIVLANVFSEILRAAAPRIVRSVAPGGCLILSGILRPQEKEVLRTFRALDLRHEASARRGKWVTLRLRAH
jgi:ribosomal protein L11 methyltransferase